MTEKRFALVKCYNEQWGIVDKSLVEEIDQLVLITTSKSGTLYIVNCLNNLYNENRRLKAQLSEAKADEKQLGIEFMGYKMKLIEVLQNKYDKVKGKTLYADVYTEIAEEMGVDLE